MRLIDKKIIAISSVSEEMVVDPNLIESSHFIQMGKIDNAQKKSVEAYLMSAVLEYRIHDHRVLTIRNRMDADRKGVTDNIRGRVGDGFPFQWITYKINPGKDTQYLTDNLMERGCLPCAPTFSEPLSVEMSSPKPKDIVYDMETNDLDDVLALILLLTNPYVNLKAITINPGDPNQMGFIQFIATQFGRSDIPMGAGQGKSKKNHVSPWYNKAYPQWPPIKNAKSATEILYENCDGDTTLVTGGALTNVARVIAETDDFTVGTMVSQGGFAGTGVVDPNVQLEKFRGTSVQPTYNFNANPKAASSVLGCQSIGRIYLVSKNVCHRVVVGEEGFGAFDEDVMGESQSNGLVEMNRLLSLYFQEHQKEKKVHDVLAACCAINPDIGDWRGVSVYKEGRAWGTRNNPETGTFIITDYFPEAFMGTLLAPER